MSGFLFVPEGAIHAMRQHEMFYLGTCREARESMILIIHIATEHNGVTRQIPRQAVAGMGPWCTDSRVLPALSVVPYRRQLHDPSR